MERVRQLKLCLKRLSRYKKMKGTVSLWLEQEGGGKMGGFKGNTKFSEGVEEVLFSP